MEIGECSVAKCDDGGVWAKLVPTDPQFSEIDIKSEETALCSGETSSSEVKQNWCVITKAPHPGTATIKNISKGTILVDEAAVEVGGTMDIKFGSEIISGPHKKGHLAYTFKASSSEKQGMDVMEGLMIPLDLENVKCSICLNIWHDVVTIAPCLHNFCNGCFSEWSRRSEKKFESVLCPQCRATVHCVGRNHFLRNIEEIFSWPTSVVESGDRRLNPATDGPSVESGDWKSFLSSTASTDIRQLQPETAAITAGRIQRPPLTAGIQ